MSTPMVELRDVSLGYDSGAVLSHVSLAIQRGEFTALTGPNGAGKTTLLRGMLRLIPLLAGRIEYGFDHLAHPPGYVPQRDTLDPIFPITVFEVVLMGTYATLPPLWHVGRAARRTAAQCLDHVGLSAVGGRPYWELSGGQKQRVLIARALAAEPAVMFLDEPTAGIDSRAELMITELLARLNRERRMTIVLVSHHVGRIGAALDSLIEVDDGCAVKRPARSDVGRGRDAPVESTA
jgi:ABC-type Mn2+/Zn2+ transport system ATPase subunit